MKKILLYTLLATAVAASCTRKDPEPGPTPTPKPDSGKVQMRFSNVAGNQPLKFQTDWYRNAHGDSFNVALFAYYISNIRLNRADGSGAYVQPNSYYLLDGYTRPASMSFDIDSVATGAYSSITLTIGVDSAMNINGAHTGALDPIWGYYWGWNAGYIFLKFNGTTSKNPLVAQTLEYHVGGYSGPYNALRTLTLPLPVSLAVTPGKKALIEIEADILRLFDAPHQMDFTQTRIIHDPGPEASKVADNYARMLRVKAAAVE